MRYDGTRATLRGRFGYGFADSIEIHDHLTGLREEVDLSTGSLGADLSGHGGGDSGLMAAFVRALRPGPGDVAGLTTSRESLESHLMAFAAEEARVDGSIVSMDEFRRRVRRALAPVAGMEAGAKVAVFTSALPAAICIAEALGLEQPQILSLAGTSHNTGISVLRVGPGKPELISFNSASHLPDEMLTHR